MHHRPALHRAARRPAVLAALALLAVPLSAAHADIGPNVLTAVATLPDGTPASGAVATLTAADPIEPVQIGQAIADAAGSITITIPATPELVARAHRSADLSLSVVLDVIVEKVTDGVSENYRTVEALNASLVEAGTQVHFIAPKPHVVGVNPISDFDPLAAATAGLQTLADKAEWVADTANPLVAQAIQATQDALAEHDISPENPVVAYNISTVEGTMVYVTDMPSSIVLNPVDADVYEVLPLGASAPVAIDTTQAYNETYEALGLLPSVVQPSQGRDDAPAQAKWGKNNGDCYGVTGPAENPRYLRRVCWEIDFQNADSNKTDSFWQFELEAQGNSLNGYNMERMWVEGKPNYGHTATIRDDGIPVPQSTNTRTEPCNTSHETFSLKSGDPTEFGWQWTWDKITCETYGPKLYDDAGHYASIWSADPIPADNVRHVKFGMPIKTQTKDGGPVWLLLTGQATRS